MMHKAGYTASELLAILSARQLKDGQVVFACGEERLSRTKLQSGFPERALRMGFERTGWTPESIDAVAYAFFDWDEEARLIAAAVAEACPEFMAAESVVLDYLKAGSVSASGYAAARGECQRRIGELGKRLKSRAR